MGIAQTGTIFRGLTFDGESSKDYGIYITGAGVYNAPERDVEMVTIPGRDGSFAFDRGRFENVEVTYHCGLFGDNQEDFAEGISAFRNLLASRRGYVRLSDDYNVDEYRMAVYKGGLEVSADAVRAGEFDLVFDCKPQRFLTIGETAISVASGDTLTNPTLFPAHPLLSFEGIGNIYIGNNVITVNDVPFGWIVVNGGWRDVVTTGRNAEKRYTIDTANLNTGDQIQIGDNGPVAGGLIGIFTHPNLPFDDATITYGTRDFGFNARIERDGTDAEVYTAFSSIGFTYGTSASKHAEVTLVFKKYESGSMINLATIEEEVIIDYNGNDRILIVIQSDSTTSRSVLGGAKTLANSTVSTLTGVTYVDLDIAEAYVMTQTGPESANDHVIIGADVPELLPGITEIIYDSTITSLQIVPRWWKI